MKCQKCKSKEATTHVKKVVNGAYEEYMLCSECAHAMGYDNVFDMELSDMFGGLLQSFFTGALPARSGASRCPACGSTYGDITNTGKVGCATCYEAFYSELLPSIKRIHGNTAHCGKNPANAEVSVSAAEEEQESEINETEQLKAELIKVIEEQNFERAAEIRDRLKELEGK